MPKSTAQGAQGSKASPSSLHPSGLPMVVLIGRPNVGKSTLFNRLTGHRWAITDPTPGVTRDWREGEGRIADLRFIIVDSAGIDERPTEDLAARMTEASYQAAQRADVCLILCDGKMGLHGDDIEAANRLRRIGKPCLVVFNKCEAGLSEDLLAEGFRLGFGEPIAISAEHGLGMADLFQGLRPWLDDKQPPDETETTQIEKLADTPLKIAVVGRPNAGKSTLINRILGHERLLVGPEAGITRDAVYLHGRWKGRPIRITDTAGLRRKAKIYLALEKAAASSTIQALELAEVVVLLISADLGLEKQDLSIAGQCLDEGRGLIIGVSKSDLVPNINATIEQIKERLVHSLPQAAGVTVVAFSATMGLGLHKLMTACFDAHEIWNQRIPTAKLNAWLAQLLAHHPPPASQGLRPKPKYIAQVKTRPPCFMLNGARVKTLPKSWQSYLINRLRQDFDLPGVPIRLLLKEAANPYQPSRSRSRSA